MANIQTGQLNPADLAKIPAAERNANFVRMTRQFLQTESSIAGAVNGQISFDLTKVRLSAKVRVLVEATLTATHASATTYVPAAFAPYSMIRNVRVDLNNGFAPFTISGTELYMYNLMRPMAQQMQSQPSGRAKVVQGVTSSAGGTANVISFMADLPLALNDRDPMGMLITQNQATNVTVSIDFADGDALGSGQAGYTLTLSNIVVTPLVESFAIPPVPQAFPDVSMIKLVQSTKQSIPGSGSQIVKLTTGYTYRKLAIFIADANGVGVTDDSIPGQIELILNQADIPYRMRPAHIAKINHEQFGYVLPQGLYCFDFTYQGLANLGGTRDYVDTERLTEFWIRFNAPSAGSVTCVYEQLTLLR
jgi:hypothetical protein